MGRLKKAAAFTQEAIGFALRNPRSFTTYIDEACWKNGKILSSDLLPIL
jgi:hypothetical protein